MHTVDMLEQALAVAQHLGYQIRQEWLGGNGGGPCLIKGKKVLFLDLALNAQEQLGQVAGAIRSEPFAGHAPMSPVLRRLLGLRMSA